MSRFVVAPLFQRMMATCLLASGALLAVPKAVGASPMFELLGDATGDGGLAARFTGAGPLSAYFNPALLARAQPKLSLGLVLLRDEIDIVLASRPKNGNADVSLAASGAFHSDGDVRPVTPPPLPTEWLKDGCDADCEARLVEDPARPRPRQGQDSSHATTPYVSLGIVTPLVPQRLVLGLALLLPTTELTRGDAFFVDEREQYFSNSLHPELYSDRLAPLSLAVGLGSQLVDALSIGVSFTLGLTNSARAPAFVPDAREYDKLSLASKVSVAPSLSPHFSVCFTPNEALAFTATLHTVQALEVDAAFGSFLPDGSEQFATRRFTHHYLPVIVGLGASYELKFGTEHALSMLAGGTWTRWSSYRDRHDYRPSGAYAWSDTLSPTIGFRYQLRRWQAALDATLATTPVPDQTGRTNYVDNTRLGFAPGAHYRFELFGASMRAGLSAQLHRLLPRSHTKLVPKAGDDRDDLVRDEVPDDAVEKLNIDQAVVPRDGLQTNNPGFPGFDSEGWLLAGSASLELLL